MAPALFHIDADPIATGILVGAIALLALIYLLTRAKPRA
jgi:hypothetical protein